MILKVLILPIYCRIMATTEELAKNKRIKNFLKDFFKVHKQFKEVSDASNCDAILIFDKTKLKSCHIVVYNEVKKDNPPPDPDDSCKIVYLKNSNPHDSRKATRGYVRRVTQKFILRNYTQ